MSEQRDQLEELARFCGAQPSYTDVTGQLRPATDEALVRVLQSLDAPIEHASDAPDALRVMRQRSWERVLPPTTVRVAGRPGALAIRLPEGELSQPYRVHVSLEGGGDRRLEGVCSELEAVDGADLEGRRYRELHLPLPEDLPLGRHGLTAEVAGSHTGWLLSVPDRMHLPEDLRTWGLFAPTYALRGSTSWSAGHLGDLEHLAEWIGSLGGGLVGTLPLLAAFLDEPFEPSPYAPVSRLAWNELFLDLERVPEWRGSAEARALVDTEEWRHALAELREQNLVDYRRQWVHVVPVLDLLADRAFAQPDTRSELQAFAGSHPHLQAYARFRAIHAEQERPWGCWPEALRDGRVSDTDGDPRVYRRHLYAQWRLSQQLDALCSRARENGPGLYLDMPLGVHPDGYDAWHERESFASGLAAGAPPDDFFTHGQNWGFAPLHPRHVRERGYRYLSACLRNQLERAGMLRIDHVMWMHRLFCIPDGMDATEGVYVRYRPEEMWGVLALESRRHRSVIVGEDLGTVPDEVRREMADRGALRMYVVQYEVGPDRFGEIPQDCVASMNTHDMPPFASWWRGQDVDQRVTLGYLDPREADREKQARAGARDRLRSEVGAGDPGAEPERDDREVLEASLERLARSPARVVLVTLEDLWLEQRSQNVPGTGTERPNWRGRARMSLESLQHDDAVITQLKCIDERRRA